MTPQKKKSATDEACISAIGDFFSPFIRPFSPCFWLGSGYWAITAHNVMGGEGVSLTDKAKKKSPPKKNNESGQADADGWQKVTGRGGDKGGATSLMTEQGREKRTS